MEDFDNVLDGITPEDIEKTKKEVKEYNQNKKKKWSIFDDTVDPVEVNPDTLKRFARTYTASSPVPIPNVQLEVLDRIVAQLDQLGFTFRSMADKQDKLNNEITDRANRKEFYVPWAKFNNDVEPKLAKPTKRAYEVACWIEVEKRKAINNAKGKNIPDKDIIDNFNMLKPAIKTFAARNVHLILGEDCETAINFLLIYTEDGAETRKDIQYDKSGRTSYFIEVCEKLNIPVFNLFKQDCENRLMDYLNTFK